MSTPQCKKLTGLKRFLKIRFSPGPPKEEFHKIFENSYYTYFLTQEHDRNAYNDIKKTIKYVKIFRGHHFEHMWRAIAPLKNEPVR